MKIVVALLLSPDKLLFLLLTIVTIVFRHGIVAIIQFIHT